MFKWNRYFEEVSKAKFFNQCDVYKDKIIVASNTNTIMEKK